MNKKSVNLKKALKDKKCFCKKCNNKFIRTSFGQKFCVECGIIEKRKRKNKAHKKYYFKRKKENPRRCIICNCIVGNYRKFCNKCNQEKIKIKNKKYNEKYKERKRQKNKQRRLKLRIEIFKRDSFACVFCGRKSPEVILQIDHIHPKSKGGENNKKNYQTLCRECNIGKRDMILNEFKI